MSDKHKRGLYIRVGPAEFKRLSREQVRKMKKVDENRELLRASLRMVSSLRGLIGWMELVDRRGHRMTGGDIHVIRLPNRSRLLKLVEDVDDIRRKL